MLLLEDGYLSFPKLDVGHVSLLPEPCCRCHKTLGDLHALTLGLDLRLELRVFGSKTLDQGGKTLAFGVGSLFLGRNLARE